MLFLRLSATSGHLSAVRRIIFLMFLFIKLVNSLESVGLIEVLLVVNRFQKVDFDDTDNSESLTVWL